MGDLEKKVLSEDPERKGWKERFGVVPVPAGDLESLIDQPIPYLIWPLVVRGSLTQIQGIAKGGKSAFSIYLSVCATMNLWQHPQYIRANRPLKVAYIAWEDPKIMMAKRLSLYMAGLGLDRKKLPADLVFLFGPDIFIERQDHLEALKSMAVELKPDIIFIDTLSHIHLCEENSSSEIKVPMKNLDRFAKEADVGVVYLHHTNKSGGNGATQDKSRGSSAIAAAWHVMVDWGTREKGSNVNPVLIQSKYEHEWIDLAISYHPGRNENKEVISVAWAIDGAEPEVKEKGSMERKQETIVETIKLLTARSNGSGGWLTVREVVDACGLGLDSQSIQRHLTKLCEAKVLTFKEGNNKAKVGPLTPNLYKLKVKSE